jgi:radical SAM superfamily enzyme YgiQ (UPF0313 family)
VSRKIWPRKRYPVSPLGLATLAALTPSHWQVTIVDENVESLENADLNVDIIGVCGMSVQVPRQRELLAHFRSRGYYVVAGGSRASLTPEEYESIADAVVAGEAEYLWPQFCRDFEDGQAAGLYHETGTVALESVPVPRFDLLKCDRYSLAALQFSRGCPFRCEFCDIIVMFGRKPRTKPLHQVEAELDALRELNVRNVFFVDDNLIGHKPKCKELLHGLIDYQRRHNYRFYFGTEASINLAQDDELLDLLREANFGWVFIGIETPDPASLEETLKFQNLRQDLVQSVQNIHARGIDVQAGFIIGFDADDHTVFDRQFEFIQNAGITLPMLGLLQAIPRTPLFTRLKKAGRLIPDTDVLDTKASTNVIPQNMTYGEMIEGYLELMRRLFDDEAIYNRLESKFSALGPVVQSYYTSVPDTISVGLRFIWHSVLSQGPRRWYYFLKSLLLTKGNVSRLVALVDGWIASLAIRDFLERRLIPGRMHPSQYPDFQVDAQISAQAREVRGQLEEAP